jgi:hypothetical protein
MGYEIVRPTQGLEVFEKDFGSKPVVYLGGNSRGRDWRIEFLHRFENEEVVFINPRRDSYAHPEEMPNEHAEQVLWERHAVDKADIALFWLGEGLANQAARVEIGFALGAQKYVIIGAEPGFLGLEHLSAFSGLILSTSVSGLMDRMDAALREVREAKSA